MFSVIFPGQGSQMVGMGREFYDKFELVKNLFKEADDTLNFSISKLILEGPKEELNFTENTQPAIFLISYSIYNVVKKEFSINLSKAKYFAGHSLGEYSALSCAGYLNFSDTLKILRIRGNAMQNSVPKGEGGMVAVLGSTVEMIEKILKDNEKSLSAQIANDNSEGQIVLSGKTDDLDKLILILKENTIKNVKLPVSAPFHCSLMNKATNIMSDELNELNLTANTQPAIFLISYSIFNVIKKEFNIDLNKAKYFAGHSLGEYSALSCGGYLAFSDTLKILSNLRRIKQNIHLMNVLQNILLWSNRY